MGRRRKGREIVLQSLYASLMGGGDVTGIVEDQLLRRDSAPETTAFARELAARVKANRAGTERWLGTLISSRWDPSRLGALERCILLLGLSELRYSPEVPFRAVINEACELAHRYCEDGAVGFINAVLDRAAHETYPDLAVTPAAGQPVAAVDDGDDEEDEDLASAGADAELDADFGDTPLRGAPGGGGDPA